jgi:copper(I)-binding protein
MGVAAGEVPGGVERPMPTEPPTGRPGQDPDAERTVVASPQAPPDVYARIRRLAPVLVVLFCAGLLIVVALVRPFQSPPSDVELRASFVGADADPTAAYVQIHNAGGNDTLLDASTPAAATVELQQRQASPDDPAGVLVAVDQLEVPGYTDTSLQPGGDQLLLTGLTRPLAVGDTVELTLRFERSGSRTVEAEVASYLDIAGAMIGPRVVVPDGGTDQPG